MDLDKLRSSDGCIASARLPEVVTALEELASGWCQQIEQVSVNIRLSSVEYNIIIIINIILYYISEVNLHDIFIV